MRRIASLAMIVVFLFSFVSNAQAEKQFSIRNGLTWGDSKESCLKKLKGEGLELYPVETNTITAMFPNDKGKNEIWSYLASVSLGKDDEVVLLNILGTNKTGLFELSYYIQLNNGGRNNRIQELREALEKKYEQKFKTDTNKYDYDYVAWWTFDNAYITIYTMKGESDTIYIAYYSLDRGDILTSINDGTYYKTIPYGL